MPRRTSIVDLPSHPNRQEINAVLAAVPHLGDHQLTALATTWRNTSSVAEARSRALSCDSPLVVEVLAAFDTVAQMFAEDVTGGLPYVDLDPAITTVALKAVRDAIAAAFAKPVLTRTEHRVLQAPWVQVVGSPRSTAGLGPRSQDVERLVAALPSMAWRCHDERGRQAYDELLGQALALDSYQHADAVDAAWTAAVATGRRRLWTVVRRRTEEGMTRGCATCNTGRPRNDGAVLQLCQDAACALLVADSLDDRSVEVLTAAVRRLVPQQRSAGES